MPDSNISPYSYAGRYVTNRDGDVLYILYSVGWIRDDFTAPWSDIGLLARNTKTDTVSIIPLKTLVNEYHIVSEDK